MILLTIKIYADYEICRIAYLRCTLFSVLISKLIIAKVVDPLFESSQVQLCSTSLYTEKLFAPMIWIWCLLKGGSTFLGCFYSVLLYFCVSFYCVEVKLEVPLVVVSTHSSWCLWSVMPLLGKTEPPPTLPYMTMQWNILAQQSNLQRAAWNLCMTDVPSWQ